MVQIRVSARQTTVSDRDRDLIIEKIDRLSKYLAGMDRAEVHFSEERNPRIPDKEVCEVTLEGHGHHVRCTANGPDHLTAVDRAVEKLENKLHKLKTKLARKPRHKSDGRNRTRQASTELSADLLDEPVGNGTVAGEAPDLDYRIVRSKTVEKLTLSPQDAVLRMDLVGHPFYFFTNAETGRAAVVYWRSDGDVGLIDEVDADVDAEADAEVASR